MTGDAPVTDTVSASVTLGGAADWATVDDAAGSAAMSGAAVGSDRASPGSIGLGSVGRGIPIIAGAFAANAVLFADAVLGDDAADVSTLAICAVREEGDGRSRVTAITATPRAATAAVQAQRGRTQTKTEDG